MAKVKRSATKFNTFILFMVLLVAHIFLQTIAVLHGWYSSGLFNVCVIFKIDSLLFWFQECNGWTRQCWGIHPWHCGWDPWQYNGWHLQNIHWKAVVTFHNNSSKRCHPTDHWGMYYNAIMLSSVFHSYIEGLPQRIFVLHTTYLCIFIMTQSSHWMNENLWMGLNNFHTKSCVFTAPDTHLVLVYVEPFFFFLFFM